jgi:hypothetical protein
LIPLSGKGQKIHKKFSEDEPCFPKKSQPMLKRIVECSGSTLSGRNWSKEGKMPMAYLFGWYFRQIGLGDGGLVREVARFSHWQGHGEAVPVVNMVPDGLS